MKNIFKSMKYKLHFALGNKNLAIKNSIYEKYIQIHEILHFALGNKNLEIKNSIYEKYIQIYEIQITFCVKKQKFGNTKTLFIKNKLKFIRLHSENKNLARK